MIFQTQDAINKILAGTKTQSRRIVKPGDEPMTIQSKVTLSEFRLAISGDSRQVSFGDFKQEIQIVAVANVNRHPRYEMGKTYAIQPGRAQKAVARIKIISIRQEDVRLISNQDTKAEGFDTSLSFLATWASMHDPSIAFYREEKYPIFHVYATRQAAQVANIGARGWRETTVYELTNLLLSRPAKLYLAWALTFELVR